MSFAKQITVLHALVLIQYINLYHCAIVQVIFSSPRGRRRRSKKSVRPPMEIQELDALWPKMASTGLHMALTFRTCFTADPFLSFQAGLESRRRHFVPLESARRDFVCRSDVLQLSASSCTLLFYRSDSRPL